MHAPAPTPDLRRWTLIVGPYALRLAWLLPLALALAKEPSEPRVEDYLPEAWLGSEPAGRTLTNAPMSLEACLRIALDHSPVQRAAREGITAASHLVGESRAPYYPDLSASVSYGYWQRHAFLPGAIMRPGMPTIIGPTDDWMAGLRARYTLLDFGERAAQLRAALARQNAAKAEARVVRLDLVQNVRQAFYACAAAQVGRQVAERHLGRAEDHVRLARERQAAGVVPRTDVLRAQVEVADARLALLKTHNLVRVSAGALNTTLGLPVELATTVAAEAAPVPPPTDAGLAPALAQALQSRPEIQAALQRVSVARSGVSAARSAFAPRVRAEAQAARHDSRFLPEDDEWTIGVSIEQPLFSGFARKHKLARSRAEVAKADAEVEQLVLAVRHEVWAAHSKLREACESARAAQALVDQATESLRFTRERYAAGASLISDLLDAQTALARAEAQLTEAQWDSQMALAAYRRALGDPD